MAKEARTIHPQRFFGAVVDELPNSDLTKLSISVFEYYKAGREANSPGPRAEDSCLTAFQKYIVSMIGCLR